MSQANEPENFAALLQALAENLVLGQLRLDQDYNQRLQEWIALMKREPAAASLLRQLMPAAMVMDHTTLELAVQMEQAKSEATTIGVKMLNLSYQRKYSYSEFTSSQLQITVQRVPFAPKG